jgi:hypothetical protein
VGAANSGEVRNRDTSLFVPRLARVAASYIIRPRGTTSWSMIFSENRYPPRIKCGAGFFGIML